ncbi:MAG: hypothetical protein M3O01_00435 [Pseudomonadota bacterium]|nr:hypothetical protein [Pseudomonadota bacterium]
MNSVPKIQRYSASLLIAVGAAFWVPAHAADPAASGPALTKSEASDLKTQSEANYKARQKVSEAKEDLNKADCKSAMEGSAKRACEASAKQHAKAAKADAKTQHELEEQNIDRAKK